jgi:hypothetical protein
VGQGHATEVRVAFAEGPASATTWTSLRVEGAEGPFALVVPLPEGAFVDRSSDAWFEALEVATAPRVVPPAGLSAVCPGAPAAAHPFEVAGDVAHTESLAPEAIALAVDAAAVSSWAAEQGLALGGDAKAALGAAIALGSTRFLCVRFTAPNGGPVLTPTLRVTAPKGLAALPFSLVRGSGGDVRVSAWLFGEGRGELSGTTLAPVAEDAIVWNAKTQASNYLAYRDAVLASDPERAAVESAGHGALAETTFLAGGGASIDPVALTYFERAAAYGDAAGNPDACTAAASAAIAGEQQVSAACPRGDLVALSACSPAAPGADQIDPAKLACGGTADDLALALSGSSPKGVWLTRRAFVVAASHAGEDRAVSFAAGWGRTPIVEAQGVDVSGCNAGSGGAGGAGGSGGSWGAGGASGSSGSGTSGSNGSGWGDQGGSSWGGGSSWDGGSSVAVNTSGCDCSGDPGVTDDTSSSDSCDGSGADSSGDGCSGDASGGDSCSGDSADGCDSSGAGDACDAGAGADACSGAGDLGGDCSVSHRSGQARRRVAPRLSVMTMAALALLLPLRRRGSRKKRIAPMERPSGDASR